MGITKLVYNRHTMPLVHRLPSAVLATRLGEAPADKNGNTSGRVRNVVS